MGIYKIGETQDGKEVLSYFNGRADFDGRKLKKKGALFETVIVFSFGCLLVMVLFISIMVFNQALQVDNNSRFCEHLVSDGPEYYWSQNTKVEPGYIECCSDGYVQHLKSTSCEIFKR